MDEQILANQGVEHVFNIPYRLIFQITGDHFRIDGIEDGRSNQKVPGVLIQPGKDYRPYANAMHPARKSLQMFPF